MSRITQTRRTFLKRSAGLAAAGGAAPYFFTASSTRAGQGESKNDRLIAGCIGNGGMGRGDASKISGYADIVALSDVDRSRSEGFLENEKLNCPNATIYEDYRELLDRKDIDVVTISTPDHWHTRIAVDAMRAGKDIYCQKPLTLTIDEGKILCRVLKETGRVFQVGTQQRSASRLFLTAVAMVQSGRIGKVRRVTCAIGGARAKGPFEKTDPPEGLNWDMWLGQAPMVDYIKERCHSTFRWWYEYSGGKLTDWGAHHVDIGQWAIGMENTGPTTVKPVSATHPVPLVDGYPTRDDSYNTATEFMIDCTFPGDVELRIRHDTDNGLLFEGEKGRFFVNRSKIVGKPVEALADDPIPEDVLVKLRKGKADARHMDNFIQCVKDRSLPISDVFSHHRVLTTCHLANIAIRLGRTLTWDAEAEQIVGDDEANSWQKREQRKGYEIET